MPRAFELRELPLAVVDHIFRSVSFLDRIRCEQTCRDWRDFIHNEMAPKTVEMRLLHVRSYHDHLRPWVADQTADSFLFMVPVGPSFAAYSFVAWFSRRKAELKELTLLRADCQLPCIQRFDHTVAELSLQAGATFHGALGTSSSTESYRICFLW